MNLECPKCGYNWNYKGKAKRAQCTNCKQFFQNPAWTPAQTSTKPAPNQQISDDIMHGNISEALEKADVDPMNNRKELMKDMIPLILKDANLKFAFVQACSKLKKSPESMIRICVKFWLMENEYL